MGFKLTLRGANRIANLACGRVDAAYKSIYRDSDNFAYFLEYLAHFAEAHCRERMESERGDILRARDTLQSFGFGHGKKNLDQCADDSEEYGHDFGCEIPDALTELASILDEYPIKSLLLPDVRNIGKDSSKEFMMSEEVLRRLLEQDPECTCLIVQPREVTRTDRVTIFDAFPAFKIALRQIDQWPAVLFWNERDGEAVFVPVADEEELYHIYSLAREADAFAKLRAYAQKKLPPSHYYMHLSDLHFGVRRDEVLQKQLQTLVTQEASSLDNDDILDFLITGDIVDSPTPRTIASVQRFAEFLDTVSHSKPIFVSGNHDINLLGLAFHQRNQHWAHIAGGYPKIRIADDIGVIFMLFNSNTRGFLAQGEIGKQQMQAMREQLAGVENLENYTLIAVLHHHVASSEYYKRTIANEEWQEGLNIYRDAEKFKRLRDADAFLAFLDEYRTKFVLHGHKHTPIVIKRNDMYIISCGSTIGHNRSYVSYNMLKFADRTLTCTQFVEQLAGAKTKRRDVMALAIDY